MPMRLADLAVGEEIAERGGGGGLAELSPHIMNARIERRWRAEQRLQRHRAGDVRDAPQLVRIDEPERRDGGVGLRAVDEREAFLRLERYRLETGGAQHCRGA